MLYNKNNGNPMKLRLKKNKRHKKIDTEIIVDISNLLDDDDTIDVVIEEKSMKERILKYLDFP